MFGVARLLALWDAGASQAFGVWNVVDVLHVLAEGTLLSEPAVEGTQLEIGRAT